MSLSSEVKGSRPCLSTTGAQAPFAAQVHDASRETFNEVSIEDCKVSLLHVQQAEANLHEAKLSEAVSHDAQGPRRVGPPGDARRCRNERLTARGRSKVGRDRGRRRKCMRERHIGGEWKSSNRNQESVHAVTWTARGQVSIDWRWWDQDVP